MSRLSLSLYRTAPRVRFRRVPSFSAARARSSKTHTHTFFFFFFYKRRLNTVEKKTFCPRHEISSCQNAAVGFARRERGDDAAHDRPRGRRDRGRGTPGRRRAAAANRRRRFASVDDRRPAVQVRPVLLVRREEHRSRPRWVGIT